MPRKARSRMRTGKKGKENPPCLKRGDVGRAALRDVCACGSPTLEPALTAPPTAGAGRCGAWDLITTEPPVLGHVPNLTRQGGPSGPRRVAEPTLGWGGPSVNSRATGTGQQTAASHRVKVTGGPSQPAPQQRSQVAPVAGVWAELAEVGDPSRRTWWRARSPSLSSPSRSLPRPPRSPHDL